MALYCISSCSLALLGFARDGVELLCDEWDVYTHK